MALIKQIPSDAVQFQQAQQKALTTLLAKALGSAWDLVDYHDLSGTLPKFQATVAGLVRWFGLTSAKVAADFYQHQRQLAGVAGKFTPRLADPPALPQVQAVTSWATKGLWSPTGYHDGDGPLELPGHIQTARTLVEGATQKMVVDTGRHTLLNAVSGDGKARGYVREAQPNACYFCALLAIRKPVYKEDSFAKSNEKFDDDKELPSTIKVHDHCHCIPVAVWSSTYKQPAHVQEWQARYDAMDKPRTVNGWRQVFASQSGSTAEQQPAA